MQKIWRFRSPAARICAMKIHRLFLPIYLICLSGNSALAQQADIEWLYRSILGSVTLNANPLGQASRAAFYAARGFSAQQIQPYSAACGFSFGMQNNGTQPITVKLADWRAIGADGRTSAVHLPEHWDADWAKAGVPQAARIAFKWAQFQTENVFEPGDWIMGMVTLKALPTAPFQLIARYHDKQGDYEITLDKLACAD